MGTRAGLAYPEGNPAALTAAAGRLSDLAARIERASASVGESTGVSGWEGHRYGVFTSAGRTLANVLEPGGSALRRASSELDQLATQLKDAQRRIEDWADEIEAAERRLQTAGSALNALMFANPLREGSNGLSSGLGHAQAKFEKAGSELDELRARYVPKARQLCERVRQEDERTASALRTAAAAAPKSASSVPTPAPKAGGGSGPLTFFEFKKDSSAEWANEDGAFGGHASASIEAMLADFQTQFNDGASTFDVTAGVGADAEASARAEVGPTGVHLGAGGEAQLGAKGSVTSTLGSEDSFAFKPSFDGRLGPGAEASANLDAGAEGLHFEAHAGLSALVGGGVHVEVDVDPGGLLEAARDAPRTLGKIKDMFD